MIRPFLVLSASALLAGIAMPALAAVPDANGFYRLDETGDEFGPVTRFDRVPLVVNDTFTTVSVLGQSQPSISVVSLRGSPSRESSGEARLIYFFRYQAANLADYDALLASDAFLNFAGISTITDSRTGNEGFFSTGRTQLGIRGDGGLLTDVEYACGNFRNIVDGCGTQAFSFDHDINNFADQASLSLFGSVTLHAFSENGGDGVQVDRSSAFIDPIITLRADGLDLSRYTLQLSNGIGNGVPLTSGVPEPASWALMLAGFGLVGSALRRKTRTSFAAA